MLLPPSGGHTHHSPPPSPDLPEQTGERMRGGAVSAASAASTGPRKPAASPRKLALPRQKLLHRGQVSRARRFEKFLLLSHCGHRRFRRRRGGNGENRGAWLPDEIPLCSPLFLTPRPQVIYHYSRSFGEETKAPSADGSVYPDPRCRWRKSLVGSAVPASSKLPPSVPPSCVRHFLGTTLFFGTSKPKTLRAAPAPPPELIYKKVDGYKQYGAPA